MALVCVSRVICVNRYSKYHKRFASDRLCNIKLECIGLACLGLGACYTSIFCSVKPHLHYGLNFWHVSDKNGTRTQKNGSARVNFVV